MFSIKLRRILAKLNIGKDMKIQSKSKKKLQTKKKLTVELPDNVWNLIFDYSSPFDVIKWQRVSKHFKRIIDNRVKRTLYLNVLRMDITQILPKGVMGDDAAVLYIKTGRNANLRSFRGGRRNNQISHHSFNQTQWTFDSWKEEEILHYIHLEGFVYLHSIVFADGLKKDILITAGDFFRQPSCNLLAHHEHRSILLAAHAQWTTKEAAKLLRAIQFFGKHAHTIVLDSSIAELCVAGQCTTDISAWFAFHVAAGGTDSTAEFDGIQTPGWLQSEAKFNMSTHLGQSDGDLPQWNPTTQRIPLGPLFPEAKEITFRCSVPQLCCMRRLAVYNVPATMIFSPEQLQVFRLSITGGRSNAPANIKLRPFREWLDADQLGNKLCVQFC